MSIPRILALVGICLLLTGCVPVTGFKSVALLVSLLAACGAAWGFSNGKTTDRVCQKAKDLDDAVTEHQQHYHCSPTDSVVIDLQPTHRGNGVASPEPISRFHQRM